MPELSTTPRVFSVSRRLKVAAVEEKGRKTNWWLREWRPRNFWPSSSTAVTLNPSFPGERMRIFRFETNWFLLIVFLSCLFSRDETRWWKNDYVNRSMDILIFVFLFFGSIGVAFEWVKVMIECFLNGSKREWERCTVFVWFLVRILRILIVVFWYPIVWYGKF